MFVVLRVVVRVFRLSCGLLFCVRVVPWLVRYVLCSVCRVLFDACLCDVLALRVCCVLCVVCCFFGVCGLLGVVVWLIDGVRCVLFLL